MVPHIATHPGELLKDELKERNMTQKELSRLINQPAPVLNDIIKGKRSINAEMAVLLETVLEIPSNYWLNLQNQYDIDSVNINEKVIQTKKNIEIWQVLSTYIPVNIFKKLGYINDNLNESIEKLKMIFRFTDLDQLIENYSEQLIPELYRKSEKHSINEVNLFGWRYLAKWKAKEQVLDTEFNIASEHSLVEEIKSIFLDNKNTLDKLKSTMNKYGIKFIVLEKFDKTPVDGISFWEGNNPTVVVTLRYKRIDNLAFSVMHEIAHIYHHHLENSGMDMINFEFQSLSDLEKEADSKACSYLIADSKWNNFMKTVSPINHHAIQLRIKNFAKENNINPAIVLGRYKKETNIFALKSSINFEIN